MMRCGSFLLIVFLALPMMLVCCFPMEQTAQCHVTTRVGDQTCITHQAAIAETQSSQRPAAKFAYRLPMGAAEHFEQSALAAHLSERVASAPRQAIDICLRTGALLI